VRLLRGRESPGWEALLASTAWQQCRELLARCDRPPELTLT